MGLDFRSETVSVAGFDALYKTLKQLPQDMRRSALRSGVRKGARVIQGAAIANAPEDTGNLKSTLILAKDRETRGFVRFVIGPSARKKGSRGRYGFYGMFLEFGTLKLPARPWLRPAVEQRGETAVREMAEATSKGIISSVNRLTRRFAPKRPR